MSAQLGVETTETTTETGYVVSMRVLTANGIEPQVFVFSLDDVFSHVATTRDMANFPNSRAYAVENNLPFYRDVRMSLTLQSPALARTAREALDSRLAGLLAEWNAQPTPAFGEHFTKVYE